MVVALLLSLAEVPAPPPEAPPHEAASPSGNCAPRAVDEIVVCGSREGPSPYRIPKVSGDHATTPIRAAVQIAPGAELSLNAGSAALPGAQGAALMVRLKIKF